MGRPVYLVPGNHDVNYDTPDPAHAYETFKMQFGPTYYSFNYGDVHFVVLSDVVYPSPLFLPARTYHGEIDAKQMQWLANDLKYVPEDHLIVLNMHIPIVSDVDRLTPKHNVANRQDLYNLLSGRKVVSLGGHTHTLDHFQPGDNRKVGTAYSDSSGYRRSKLRLVVVGDLDNNGIPMSYQRDGAPRGHMVWNFHGSEYNDQFRASGKDKREQMHLSFFTPSWKACSTRCWLTQI